MGCSGLSVVNPSIMATRQSFWSAATNTDTNPAHFSPNATDSCNASGPRSASVPSVFNQQLAGTAQVVIADGGDEQPAAAKVGFLTPPGDHQRLLVDLSRAELEP